MSNSAGHEVENQPFVRYNRFLCNLHLTHRRRELYNKNCSETYRSGCNEPHSKCGDVYKRQVLCFSVGSMYHLYAEKLFQSTGSMVLPMIFQGVGAILNIILDPVFIFGWFHIPAMGVQGAAIATVASQIFAAGISMIFFLKKCTSIQIRLKGFHFEKNMLWKIYTVGIPSAIMMSLPSVLVAALNSVLAAFSATAIAVFGLYIKIQTFVYMPANGVIQGMRPIMSYNYGAGNRKRMKETLKASLEAVGVIMALGTVLFMAFPQGIMQLFDANAEMLEIGVPMLLSLIHIWILNLQLSTRF